MVVARCKLQYYGIMLQYHEKRHNCYVCLISQPRFRRTFLTFHTTLHRIEKLQAAQHLVAVNLCVYAIHPGLSALAQGKTACQTSVAHKIWPKVFDGSNALASMYMKMTELAPNMGLDENSRICFASTEAVSSELNQISLNMRWSLEYAYSVTDTVSRTMIACE